MDPKPIGDFTDSDWKDLGFIENNITRIMAYKRELQQQSTDIQGQLQSMTVELIQLKGGNQEQARRINDLERDLRQLRHDKERMRLVKLEEGFTDMMNPNASMNLELSHAHKIMADITLRAFAAEDALRKEKASHEITQKALDTIVTADRITSTAMVKQFPHEPNTALMSSNKRSRAPSSDATLTDSPIKKHKKKAVVICVECFQSKIGRKCDNDEQCWPCKVRDVECKRMQCDIFANDTCFNVNCGLAHSDSGYPAESLVRKHRVTQIAGPSPTIPPKPKHT